ncbi:hypothetical protein ACGFX4_40220 [Kitasatospora sp. NPDC048365]|uniref:hypothetical protein n=1 Tax=Kitasatospora sp. NPDC048365 TaxID=3364050 RepID=UPI00371EA0DB
MTQGLNDRQLTVLRRICEPGEPVTSTDSHLANSVYALRRRGLVTTQWEGGGWTASATLAGREHVSRANDPTPTPSPAADPANAPTAGPTTDAAETTTAQEAARLIADLEQAGGTLRVPDPAPDERARLRRVVHSARAGGALPPGRRLSFTGRDRGDVVIQLLDGQRPSGAAERPTPIPVPDALPAEAVHATVRDCPLQVCADCRARALRILHALATAAEQQGMTVAPAAEERQTLVIASLGSEFPIVLTESTVEVPDLDSVEYAWQRVTEHTRAPSHKLDISLSYDWAQRGRRYQWGDRRRWRLEDRLPQVLREIQQRADAARDQRLAHERQELETKLAWHAAMDRARHDLVHSHRLDRLREQVDAWHEAVRVRAYCDALRQHLAQAPAPDPEARAVLEWVAWACAHADSIDPIPTHPRTPADPAITPESLRPFLRGWSPYEPKRR